MQSFAKRQQATSAAAVVGVDAGKFEHMLVIRPRGGHDSKAFGFKTTRDGFESAVTRIHDVSGGASPSEVLVGIEFAGTYGFTLAQFLTERGFPIVSVLPSDTKRWKEVTHHQALKTDAKDAMGITDLVATGHFVSFPFLKPEYAALRHLVSSRERVAMLQRAALTRLRTVLGLVFPEYERLILKLDGKTSLSLLKAYPSPVVLRKAPKRQVLKLLREESRNHFGVETYAALIEAAEQSLALVGAQGALKDEIPLLVELIETYARQRRQIESWMKTALAKLPETEWLLTVPWVSSVTAAVFLGSIGDPRAYTSSRQVLKLAGLSLVERSSGILRGRQRISKRGRPILRRMAFIFAVRCIRKEGLYREAYESLVERNGGKKISALTALARQALTMLFAIARDKRSFTREAPAQPTRPTGQVTKTT